MPNKDYTDITIIVDRSGSMQAGRDDHEGGINSFVDGQRGGPGECRITLVQFDSFDNHELVWDAVRAEDVVAYSLVPRGATPLADAVGWAVNRTGERIAKMPDGKKPGQVVFFVVTDGKENASHEFTKRTVRDLVQSRTKVDGWRFLFLGADIDAWGEGGSIGVPTSGGLQILKDAGQIKRAYGVTAQKIMSARCAASSNGDAVQISSCYSYSQDDKDYVDGEKEDGDTELPNQEE